MISPSKVLLSRARKGEGSKAFEGVLNYQRSINKIDKAVQVLVDFDVNSSPQSCKPDAGI
jgi:hypothetical protein